jgi:hypothetical protein
LHAHGLAHVEVGAEQARVAGEEVEDALILIERGF